MPMLTKPQRGLSMSKGPQYFLPMPSYESLKQSINNAEKDLPDAKNTY
jgi:hypothetical protein